MKVIALNKKARYDYFIEETIEAGIELVGTEVKSIRLGHVNLKDSYVDIKEGQAYIHGMHISPYEKGNIFNKDPLRTRRLLLHKKEINRLFGKVKQDGMTLVPLSIYFNGSLIKLEVALAKGKKIYDKRDTIAKKDAERRIARSIKQ